MNKRHYEHTLPNIRGSLSNTYLSVANITIFILFLRFAFLFREHESNIKLFVKGK